VTKKSVKMALLFCGTLWLSSAACSPPSDSGLSPAQQRARWHSSQGVVYMDQHNYTRGRTEFEQALGLDPDYATAHANLGIAFYSLGKYDSARAELVACLGLDPEHLHANYTLGLIDHAQGGNYEHAFAAFTKVAQADADDPLVQYYLGRTLSKLNRADEALAAYGRAIAMDPNNLSAHYARAHELRQLRRDEDWRDALAVFDRLSQAGFEGVSTTYQGQGKYAEALAEGSYSERPDDRAGPVLFDAPILIAGAASVHASLDGDADGTPDLLGIDHDGTIQLYRSASDRWQPSTDWHLPTTPGLQALLVGDVDDDGDIDLMASASTTQLLRQHDGRFTPEILAIEGVVRAFGDVDHDGDIDVVSLSDRMHLSAGDGTGDFVDITESALNTGLESPTSAIFTDSDNDRDVDILAGGRRIALYANNRDGTLTDVAGLRQLTANQTPNQTRDLVVADIQADGYLDIVQVTATGLYVLTNEAGSTFTQSAQIATGAIQTARAADLDNDGDLDLVLAGPDGVQLALAVDGGLVLQTEPISSDGASRVLVEDLDADGRVDLVANGSVHLNRTQDAGHWVRIQLAGLNSVPDGYGAKVEVRTRTSQQKREVRGGSGDSSTLHIGLGAADSVEFVRILWPSGVRQTELATGGGQTLAFEELNRKGTSCPILYAWDGEKYRFVSDFLGGAIIGYLTDPGQYYTPDTDEFLKIGHLAPKHGRYEFQVANQLEEILYLDAARLVAVDHPAGTSLYPNERLLSAPPYPEAQPLALTDLRPAHRVRDDVGRDVTESLATIDDVWYADFGHRPIHGYAEEYQLVLELGDLTGWERPVLVAHGWVDYAHSTSNWAAAQRQLSLSPPRLEIADPAGHWRLVTADMGTPAGLPKDMVYDLSDAIGDEAGDVRLRITTSMAIYWDQFMVGQAIGSTRTQEERFTGSDLHWRGYPEHTPIHGTFAFRYDYDRLQTEAPWGTHAGAFTRFGNVDELVDRVDDRFVIMFHGDELTLSVDADRFGPIPQGWERTFLFWADGFGKDMDFHSAHSLTVEPLPFHGMTRYPYGREETYPSTPEHVSYRLDYNTRRVSGYYE
jgi:tetratricopeptide (TPR) repeat protein